MMGIGFFEIVILAGMLVVLGVLVVVVLVAVAGKSKRDE